MDAGKSLVDSLILKALGDVTKNFFDWMDPIDAEKTVRRYARIEAFFQSPERGLFLDIKEAIQQNAELYNNDANKADAMKEFVKKFRLIKEKLSQYKLRYDDINTYLDNDSYKKVFVKYVKECNPMHVAKDLYRWVVGERSDGEARNGTTEERLLCDYLALFINGKPVFTIDDYRAWQSEVKVTLLQAINYKLLYYRFNAEINEKPENIKNIAVDKDMIEEWCGTLDPILKKGLQALKLGTVLGKKNSLIHNIESVLLVKSKSPADISVNIGTELRNKYPFYEWSVVVTENGPVIDFQMNTDRLEDVFYRKLESSTSGKVSDTATEQTDDIWMTEKDMVCGSGLYGYIAYTRIRNTLDINTRFLKKRNILLLWVDREFVTIDSRFCIRATDFVANSTVHPERSIYAAIDETERSLSTKYVFALGEFSSDPKSCGMSLGVLGETEFPLKIGNKRNVVLIWPNLQFTSKYCSLELKGAFQRPSKTLISAANDADGERVAVKEIVLPVSEQERESQISKLDAIWHLVKNLKCDNVVRFYHQQLIAGEFWKYRLVMEWLAGGTLGDRVKLPRTLEDIQMWGRDILSGLVYLHREHVKHEHLDADHVMFQGPGPGNGKLKIIAIGLIGNTYPFRSLVPTERPNIPSDFDPVENRETYTSLGRKSDVRNFAWIFACMVCGLDTNQVKSDITPENSKFPNIEEQTILSGSSLASAREMIQKCCCSYITRSPADMILNDIFFTTDFI